MIYVDEGCSNYSNDVMYTDGLMTCLGIIAWDTKKKIAFLSHSSEAQMEGLGDELFSPIYDEKRENNHISCIPNGRYKFIIGLGIFPQDEFIRCTKDTILKLAQCGRYSIEGDIKYHDTNDERIPQKKRGSTGINPGKGIFT